MKTNHIFPLKKIRSLHQKLNHNLRQKAIVMLNIGDNTQTLLDTI